VIRRYKYLGLRIFAFPWESGEAGEHSAQVATVKKLNDELKRRSVVALAAGRGVGGGGSSDFNLTLINLMEPQDQVGANSLKPDTQYGMGKVAVSWHADSSLVDFSTIAVYHVTQPEAFRYIFIRIPAVNSFK